MTPLLRVEGPACPLGMANVDTDQLIPARFMKTPREQGYGRFLLHDLRFDDRGDPVAGFPLNLPGAQASRILVARRNFGGGSSREAAVYALVDFGIRCVIAPSFGDIFVANAGNNGLLPARVDETDCEDLLERLAGTPREMCVNLETRTITLENLTYTFGIDPGLRHKLMNGWDDIDLTARYGDEIAAFVRRDRRLRPWAEPGAPTEGKR